MPKHNHEVTADFDGESRVVKRTVVETLRNNPEAEVIRISSSRFSGDMDYNAIVTISGEIDGVTDNVRRLLEDNQGSAILGGELYIIPDENVSRLGRLFGAIKKIGEIIASHKETTASRTREGK